MSWIINSSAKEGKKKPTVAGQTLPHIREELEREKFKNFFTSPTNIIPHC